MKKAILLITLGTLFLTSCSKSYVCCSDNRKGIAILATGEKVAKNKCIALSNETENYKLCE